MMIAPIFVVDRPRTSETVAALLRAAARPAQNPERTRPAGPWTLGYVDATGMQRSVDVGEHTARIRWYAEQHHLSLIFTHVDLPDEGGLGFRALLAAIERSHPDRVLVSSLTHVQTAAVAINGEPSGETKLDRLQHLGVRIQEVFP